VLVLVSIDGGGCCDPVFCSHSLTGSVGVVQDTSHSIDLIGQGDLYLEYTMLFVDPMPVSLLQTGDLVQGLYLRVKKRNPHFAHGCVGDTFDN